MDKQEETTKLNKKTEMVQAEFVSKFTEQFQISELIKMFLNDIDVYKRQLEKNDVSDVDSSLQQDAMISKFHNVAKMQLYGKFEIALPKSIKYIKDHIFPSNTQGYVYLSSIDVHNNIIPKEVSRQEWQDLLLKFPEVLKYWCKKIWDEKYQINMSLSDKRVFTMGS